MKKAVKIGLGCVAVVFAIIGLAAAFFYFIFNLNGACESELEQSYLSPNKSKKVLVFSVGCGATTGNSTQISIVDADYNLENGDTGNIFIADDDHGKAHVYGKTIHIYVVWQDDKNIEISYGKDARIFKNKLSKNGVTVHYNPN